MDELKEIKERLEKLEKDSHPPIGLCEFDGFRELIIRLERDRKCLIQRKF